MEPTAGIRREEMFPGRKNIENRPDSERYIDSMHRLGRRGMLGAILVMLGIPTVLGIYFDALPNFRQIFQTALPLLLIFLPSNLFEVISYTPILGSSIYLTLITGEILNLKLPAVNNALKAMDVEPGTEEADIISSISIAAASFATMAVIAVGVVLALPLKPVLALPSVKIASANILPAVIGTLLASSLTNESGGGIRTRGRVKGIILPVIFVVLITFFDRQISGFLNLDTFLNQEGQGVVMSSFRGVVIILTLPIAYFSTKWLYLRKKIRVYLPGETL
jgi:hypothetical protein